jgi:regulator of protease activity HflC (stomatin/prohibitin superfamily)
MVRVAGSEGAMRALKSSLLRFLFLIGGAVAGLAVLYWMFTTRVQPNEWGVAQVRFGFGQGIKDVAYGPGLYFIPPGTTMHSFSREIHILEATTDEADAIARAKSEAVRRKVETYFAQRLELLGGANLRVIPALNIQTSDGYAVTADITLLYSIAKPVDIAKSFGWGSLYIDSFVINSFRNGVLTTLGKINAEAFYDEAARIAAVKEAEDLLKQRFAERGFQVEELLLRSYRYADNYEKSLHDKKVAVQLTEKNRKQGLVNEQRALLQQIDSKGNATITIAESEVNARIARIDAEAQLYAQQTRAKADTEVNVAGAEAKRLKAEALNAAGGRYVVALETAKMFDNIDAAVLSPEQYISFIRSAWQLIGIGQGGPPPAAAAAGAGR